jgi:hypothetical protein
VSDVLDDLERRLVRALRAGARGIALVTDEESRALSRLEAVGERLGWPVHLWSAASGVDAGGTELDLSGLLGHLRQGRDDSLWVLLDGARSLQGAGARRSLREIAQKTRGPAVVLLGEGAGHLADIPELVVEPLPVAGPEELESQIRWIGEVLDDSGHVGARSALSEHAPALARAALGLDLRSVERLVAEGILDHGLDTGALERTIARAKPGALDRTGLLERVEPTPKDELGGLESFKSWLRRRRLAFSPAARSAGIPDPRGVLLVGIQGCGKSLAARVCASVLDLPILRLDPGRLFGGTVGESEANLRRATAAAERIAPLVLWIDEIDKSLAGIDGSASDAGTAARVVGGLLTWMQERTRPVFVAATANQIDRLPPELLRRGRFDEIFFVDLPDERERESILRVHIEAVPRRDLGRVPPMDGNWEQLAHIAHQANGFTGAELENAVVEARLSAFAEMRPLRPADLRSAIECMVPLSRSHAEQVRALRTWAEGRARRA